MTFGADFPPNGGQIQLPPHDLNRQPVKRLLWLAGAGKNSISDRKEREDELITSEESLPTDSVSSPSPDSFFCSSGIDARTLRSSSIADIPLDYIRTLKLENYG